MHAPLTVATVGMLAFLLADACQAGVTITDGGSTWRRAASFGFPLTMAARRGRLSARPVTGPSLDPRACASRASPSLPTGAF